MSSAASPKTEDGADPQPQATQHARWLVSCSPDRTLVARRTSPTTTELVKLFETGSLEDAQRELELARRLDVEGIAKPRSAALDPESGRPSLVLEYLVGENLAEFVTRRGAASPRVALRIVAEVARVVADLHERSGHVHRDIKPSNVILSGSPPDPEHGRVWLIDFEHACAIARTGRPRASRLFTGGTHGYAPPEAYAGAQPGPAFDVFALGALLWFVATGEPAHAGRDANELAAAVRQGRRKRRLLAGAPPGLVDFLERSLHADPLARPSARELAEGLAALQTDPSLDALWHALRSGDLPSARHGLAAVAPSPRARELEALLRRRERLLARVAPPHAEFDTRRPLDVRAANVAAAVAPVAGFLVRFPEHRATLALRTRLRREAARLTHDVALFVAEKKRVARHAEAEATVLAIHKALLATTRFPGAAPLMVEGTHDSVPVPRLRDPLRYLALLLDDVQHERREHERLLARVHEREASLDLVGVEAAIHELQELRTGASEVVADLKDRTHRLGFYVERLASADEALEQLAGQLETEGLAIDLGAATGLRALCASRTGLGNDRATRGAGTARTVLRSLQDLVAEFPGTTATVQPAAEAIGAALDALTDAAWQKLRDAEKLLSAVPIPIRPLQALVHRIDGMRLGDLLTDRPQGTQSELLDGLERLRLQMEQARAARDRITRSAQDSLDRGHITTALFDMQRAADRFASDGEDTSQVAKLLADGLEEARRRRKDFDAAAARNLNLAARYAALLDDPRSSRDERIETLERRREALLLLLQTGPVERAGAWQQDLRDVQVSLLQERSDRRDEELERVDDLDERLGICERMLAELGQAANEPGLEASLGRVQRLVARWTQHRDRVLDDREEARVRRRRGHLLNLVRAVVLLGLLLGVFQVARGGHRDDGRGAALVALEEATDAATAASACERLGAPSELVAVLRDGKPGTAELAKWLDGLPGPEATRIRNALGRLGNR